MTEKQFDVTIIGSGPGGYVAAIKAAQLGMNVGLIEKDKLGGICLNWGCIPSKALLKSAEMAHMFKKAGEFGFTYDNLAFDWKKIIKRSRDISERIAKGVEYLMKKNKIEFISGTGKLTGKNSIEVSKDGKVTATVKTNNVILATGGSPKRIPGIEIDRKTIITSSEAMVLETQPKEIIIIGGGAIGVEFAYFFNAFGTKVTIVEMLPSLLPNADKDIIKILEGSLKKQGIEILTNTKVESVSSGKNITVSVAGKDGSKKLTADIALVAIGITGNVDGIGLEVAGVKFENGMIKANEFGQTNVNGIYAIGDVTGPPWLAHVASHQGIVAAEHIVGKARHGINRTNIPSATYCQPQVASVGMTEDAAIKAGHKVKIGKFPFRPLGKAMAMGESEGTVKLIFDEQYGELLGAHIVGPEATELIAELTIAKTLETTYEEILRTIHAHPTLSEAIMEAAGQAYGEAIHI